MLETSTSLESSPAVTVSPNVVGAPDTGEDIQDKMFNFNEAKRHLKRIIDDWRQEIDDTEVRRKERRIEIRPEDLRQQQKLDDDETIIPARVIDTNIQRELPPYINYLKNSRRIAIFECLDNPDVDVDLLEQAFTKVATYTSWETPHFKCLDGSMHHGWDAVEVVYDESKPGRFAIEQIGHDRLLFPRSAIDIQYCPRVIRMYDLTLLQLDDFVKKHSFAQDQVNILKDKRKNTSKENETIRIFKVYLKKDGIVYVAWFSVEEGLTDWLSAPEQFYCGIHDMKTGAPLPVKFYPIYLLPYRETEEAYITSKKGRGFLDCYKQEAQTALWSAFINALNRASMIYASPKTEDGTGSSLKELDIKLSGGRILSKPIEFWHMDYPDPVVLRTLQQMDVANAEETNQVNFAAINREDSRKTAKEIGAAQQQQQLLNSVQLTLFSTFIRQVYSFAWMIVQSQAMLGNIKFMLIEKQIPQQNPLTNGPLIDPQTGQPMMQTIYQNDKATIGLTYSIRAAGDVDVVAKQEIISMMQQDWGVISNTPLAQTFLTDYIKMKYPDKGERYAQVLQQQMAPLEQMKALALQAGTILDGLIKDHPEDLDNLPPEQRQAIAQVISQIQQMQQEPTQQQ